MVRGGRNRPIAVVVASSTWLKQSDYRILFSNISERDGGAIIGALEQLNIPYRFNESGGAILVPSSRVHDVRLRLASQGLPKGGAVGFELMENQKFGISQFAEQVKAESKAQGNYDAATLALVQERAYIMARTQGADVKDLATLAGIIGDSAKLRLK